MEEVNIWVAVISAGIAGIFSTITVIINKIIDCHMVKKQLEIEQQRKKEEDYKLRIEKFYIPFQKAYLLYIHLNGEKILVSKGCAEQIFNLVTENLHFSGTTVQLMYNKLVDNHSRCFVEGNLEFADKEYNSFIDEFSNAVINEYNEILGYSGLVPPPLFNNIVKKNTGDNHIKNHIKDNKQQKN